jgi:lipopolysaccharide biosynthesis glycosyltransferase
MTLALYTFANEAYVPALAALVNSACRSGFTGPIHIGSPEPLSIAPAEGVFFHVLGDSKFWPGNRKAEFVLRHPSERFVFLDADMIITDGSLFPRINQWIDAAPVVAVETLISSVDYRRHAWAKRLGREPNPSRWPAHYYNSGLFAGIFSRDKIFLQTWHETISNVLAPSGALYSDIDFPMADQDVLNAVLQDHKPPTIGIGPPDIWAAASPSIPFLQIGTFKEGGPAVLHCTGNEKPWKFTRPPNRLPNLYDRAWYQHAMDQPSLISIPVDIPRPLRRWFKQDRTTKLLSVPRRLIRAIKNSG